MIVAVLLNILGCAGDEGKVEAILAEACKWGQLEIYDDQMLPPEVATKLRASVRESDLAFAEKENSLTLDGGRCHQELRPAPWEPIESSITAAPPGEVQAWPARS